MVQSLVITLLVCTAVARESLAAPPTTDEALTIFPVSAYGVEGITAGPDGSLWFTESVAGRIGRITVDGTITEFDLGRLPTDSKEPASITLGPDGNLWFTEKRANAIGRITAMGEITEFPLPPPEADPLYLTAVGIAAGPDGNLWYTKVSGSKIGRITPTGVATEFSLPTQGAFPLGITTGPDASLWFTEGGGGRIGRITTDGHITEYPLPPGSFPNDITLGSDGNLWFTDENGGVGRISPHGEIVEVLLPSPGSRPRRITVGPDGNPWFTEDYEIGRVSLDGYVTEYGLPYGTAPFDITLGPDGSLWFAASKGIGRLSPRLATPSARPPTPPPTPDEVVPGCCALPGGGCFTSTHVTQLIECQRMNGSFVHDYLCDGDSNSCLPPPTRTPTFGGCDEACEAHACFGQCSGYGFNFLGSCAASDVGCDCGLQCPTRPTPTPSPSPSAAVCTGDCNGDGTVTVSELVQGVDIALGRSVDGCSAFDTNHDRQTGIDELIAAVANSLRACVPNQPLQATAAHGADRAN